MTKRKATKREELTAPAAPPAPVTQKDAAPAPPTSKPPEPEPFKRPLYRPGAAGAARVILLSAIPTIALAGDDEKVTLTLREMQNMIVAGVRVQSDPLKWLLRDGEKEALRWAAGKDLAQFWQQCQRGDWMLHMAGRAGIDAKTCVLCVCDLACQALDRERTASRPVAIGLLNAVYDMANKTAISEVSVRRHYQKLEAEMGIKNGLEISEAPAMACCMLAAGAVLAANRPSESAWGCDFSRADALNSVMWAVKSFSLAVPSPDPMVACADVVRARIPFDDLRSAVEKQRWDRSSLVVSSDCFYGQPEEVTELERARRAIRRAAGG